MCKKYPRIKMPSFPPPRKSAASAAKMMTEGGQTGHQEKIAPIMILWLFW
jgi:hypothetical protein